MPISFDEWIKSQDKRSSVGSAITGAVGGKPGGQSGGGSVSGSIVGAVQQQPTGQSGQSGGTMSFTEWQQQQEQSSGGSSGTVGGSILGGLGVQGGSQQQTAQGSLDAGQKLYEQRKAAQANADPWTPTFKWLGGIAQQAEQARNGLQVDPTETYSAWEDVKDAWEASRKANRAADYAGRKALINEYNAAREAVRAGMEAGETWDPALQTRLDQARERLYTQERQHGNIGLDASGELQPMAYSFGEGVGNFTSGVTAGTAGVIASTAGWLGEAAARSEYAKNAQQLREMAAFYAMTGNDNASDEAYRMADTLTQRAAQRENMEEFDPIYQFAGKLTGAGERMLQTVKENQRPVVQMGVDVGRTAMEMGFDAMSGMPLVSMGVRVFGSSTQEARDAGASFLQQSAYGAASAGIEVMTETIGGLKLYGGGQLDEVLEPALREIAGTPSGYALVRALYTMAQEGNEEVLSDLLQPLAQSIYNGQSVGENYSELQLKDILYDWLLGAASAFGGAVVESGGYAQDYKAMREMQQDLNAHGVETGRMTDEQLWQAYTLDKAGVNVAGLQSAENRAVGGETIGEAYDNMTQEQREAALVNMLTAQTQRSEQTQTPTDNITRETQTPTDEITRETAQEILRESLGEREAESAERILDLGSESNLREQAIAYHTIATEYGQTEGRSVEDALRSNVRGALNDTQVQHAYAYGESLRKSGQTVGVNGQTAEQGAQTANPVRRAGLVTAGTFEDGNTTYKAADLSKADARDLRILNDIAKAQGVDFVLYESELGEADAEGRRSYIGANGAYRNGVVYLDVNAGLIGERTEGGKTYSIGQRALLVTAAHELTHHLEQSNAAMYRQLRSFVTERLGGSDSFISYVRDAMAREDISVEAASREVVARACEEVLLDENAIREMQGKKPTLWEQIKEWVKDFVKKFQSPSGEAVEMRQYADELRRLWLDTALETPTDLRGDIVPANAPAVDPANAPEETFTASGANGQQYSLRSMSHDIAEGKMFSDLRQYCGWTQEQTDTLKKNLQGLVQYMSQYAGIVDMNESYDKGNRPYSAYKPNSDPLYTISLDFSTLCRKRLLTQHIMEQLQLQLIDAKSGKQGRILTAEEQMAIRDMLEDYAKQEKALKVACAMCYVEAARLKAPAQMERIIGDMGSVMIDYYAKQSDIFKGQTRSAQNRWKVEHGYSATDTKAAMTNKDRSAFNKFSKEFRASYTPTAAEMEVVERARNLPRTAFLSAENLTRLYTDEQTRDIYKAYTNKLREATHSKGLETDIPYYYGDSAESVSDTFIRNVVRENGMRFSSWSDFQMKHVLDMMTAVIELSTRKCSMHGYTKFLDAVRLFGRTGMMFNMSGVPAGNGFTEDGQLAFSKTESVLVYGENGEYDAIRARREFPETAGLQCIGISRAHILALLDSDIIDYIIPYHTSGLNAKLRKMAGINNWDDFQGFQNATVDKSIEQGNCPNDIWHKEPVFSEFFAAAKDPANGYKEGEAGIDTMRRAAEQYKQMCRERGLRPKFSWANSKVDANFADHPDYWKLLIDRKMINQETGKLIEQKPVEPNFDFAEIRRAVKEEVESYDPSLEDRALDYIKGHLDELPGRVKDLKARGSQNAHEAQRPTTMDRHMMDMQNGLYAAEASGLRNPSVTTRVESKNATETEYNGKITQHSLRGVEPVEPKSDAWKRGFTAEEVRRKYAGFRKSDAKNEYVEDSGKSYKERKADRIRLAQREKAGKRGNGTQRANTAPTYDRLYDTLEYEGFKGTILDASSGLGIGTDHGIQRGFDVEDIEPFYGEGYRPIFSDYSRLNKQYDVVISSAVINVLTQDDSDAMVAAIGNALKPGGRAFITVRSASSVDGSLKGGESKRLSQNAHEWVVPGSDNYQRGFETDELRAYLEDVLGPGFTVESSPKFYDKATDKWQKWGDTSAIVTRKNAAPAMQTSAQAAEAEQQAGTDTTQHSARSDAMTDREILMLAAEEYGGEEQIELAEFRDAMEQYQDYDEAAQEHLQKLSELQTERKAVTDMRTSMGEITPQEKQQRLDALDKQIASERGKVSRAEKSAADALSRVTQLEKGRALQDILVKERAAQRQRTRDKANERLLKRDARKAVEKRAKVLYDMLMKNSDKQHVPEMLKEPLGAFLQGLDFSMLEGGKETKRDAKFGAALQKISTMLNDQQAWINGDEKAKNGDFGAYLDISGENLKFLKDCSELVTEALSENQTYTINQMSGKDLKALSGFLMNLTTAIRKMNSFMANARFESVREAAAADIEYMKALGKASERAGSGLSKTAMWDNGVPYYVLKRFGEGSKAIFDSFAKGWEKMAFNVKEVIDFTAETYTTEEVNAWKREMHDFTLEDGSEIRMTTAQIMQYSGLVGREQAMKHIEQGGTRIGDIKTQKGEIHDTTHYHLTAADISAIVKTLTDRQAEVAEKLHKFMARKGAEWGNEVSMKRFGYRFYTEGDTYVPIETDSNDRPMSDTDAQENSMFRLLNLSSSKPLEPNASNALVVNDIFDVFADHMADMAKLNGLGLPVLDAIKWFNYKERIDRGDGTYDTNTLQGAMEQAFGKQAQLYFSTLMKDINGVKESGDRGGDWQGKLISNYKIAAVGLNLRVMLLQPTSYVRALTLIKPRYLAGAIFRKNAYKEAMQYSGTAVWKAFGNYDTNISRSMREQIQHNDSFGDKVKEISMTGAEFGDKWTWGGLWVACKMQTKAEKGLSGEALNQATADLFRDVIYSSQVMDSTLTRSQSMRASGKFTKLKTAFMAEPTLSYNILLDAYSQTSLDIRKYGRSEGWKRNTGKMAHAFAVYAISASFSALVESFADALRDDDDEEFVDKFLDALIGEVDKAGKRALLKGNLMQDLTIIGKIPELKDLISLFQGYGSRDMSVTAIGELKDAYEVWRETVLLQKGILDKATKTTYYGNMTLWGKIYKTLTALSHLSGYAVSNLTRDALALWNTFVPSMKIKTYEGRGAAAQAQRYIEAYRAGDRDKMWEISIGLGTDRSGFNSQLSAEIRSEYLDGDISEAQAIRMLRELRGISNLDAQDKLREWEFEKTQGYAYDKLKQTYLSGDVSEAQAMKFLRETGDKTQGEAERTMREWKFEKTHGYPYSDLKGRYVDGKVSQADTIRYVQEVTLNGLPDVKETVLHWQCLKDTGIEYDKIDERLQGGDITLDRAAGLWQKYGGMSQEDAKLKANYVTACGASAGLKDKLTQGQYKAWYNYARSAGVKVEVYADIRSTANTDEQSNISQSEAAAAITRALNSGQITRAQAEAIWKSFNKSWTTTYADYVAKHK